MALWKDNLIHQPGDYVALTFIGDAYMGNGRPQEAIKNYQEAIRIRPDYAEAHNNLGDALFETGQRQRAIEQFQEALRVKPKHWLAECNLGIALAANGQLDDSIAHLQHASQLKSDDPQIWTQLSQSYTKAARSADAVQAAETALRLATAQDDDDLASTLTSWLATHRSATP